MATVDITYYGGADKFTRLLPGDQISRVTLTVGTDIRTQNPTNAEVVMVTANGADAIVYFGADGTATAGATNSQLIKSGTMFQKGITGGHYIAVAAG
jgi:hypothetical protein